MSLDLPVAIPINVPADGLAKIKETEDALHKTEDRAEHLGKTLQGVAHAFKQVGDAIRKEAIATTASAASSMSQLANAIQLESRMLEMATGRSKDYGFQLAALQRLHEQGKISAEQYIRTLERMGAMPKPQTVANPELAMKTIGLGPAPAQRGAIGTAVDKLGAGVVAGAAGLGAISAVQQLAAIDDEYTELSNSALKFTDAGRNVGMVLADQRRLAHDLHSGLKETLGGYDAVRDATDDLNLSYDQQLRLTKTIGEAAAIGGKSTEQLAGDFHNLKVAIETGQDPGRVLIGLFKQYPDLADQMSTSLGLTRRQIVDMAKDGKLSFDDMTRSLIQDTDNLDEKFGKRIDTWAHKWDEFTDAIEQPINVQASIDALYNVDMAINRVSQDIAKQAAFWKELEEARARSFVGSYTPTRLDTADQRAADLGRSRAEEVKNAQMQLDALSQAYEKGLIPQFQYEEQAKALRETLYGSKTRQEISAYAQLLIDLERPEKDAIERYNLLGQAYMNGAISLERYSEELHKVRDTLVDLGKLEVPSVTSGIAKPENYAANIDTSKLADERVVMWADTVEGKTAKWHDELKKTREEAEKLGAAFAPAKDAFLDMLKEGEFSADKLLDALTDIGFKLLEMAALEAIGPGGGVGSGLLRGLLGGGVVGFDYTVGNDPMQRPGFAGGGSFTVGGAGSQDSKLIQFWASPRETVSVRTPEQMMAAARRTQEPWVGELLDAVRSLRPLVMVPDGRRSLAGDLDSIEADRALANAERRNGRRARRT